MVDDDEDDSGGRRSRSRDRAAAAALREAEAVERLIDNLAHELSLIGQSDLEKDKANATRQAGAAATDEQRKQIEALVTAIHEETEALRKSEEAARARNEALNAGIHMGVNALMSIVDGSASAEEAIISLTKEIAAMIIQLLILKPLMEAIGGSLGLSGGGGVGYFPPAPSVGFHTMATGGRIRGPGTATSDSIPAMLSDGEYVINARQTARHLPLIEAINEDRLPHFAGGGRVGGGGGGALGSLRPRCLCSLGDERRPERLDRRA